MATIEKINDQYRITTDTPIWWCTYDDKFWYAKGFLEAGISDIGCSMQPVLFNTEEEMNVVLSQLES